MDSVVSTILITVVILVVVFLILREVNCWYWKINERIHLQNEQNQLLTKILSRLGSSALENANLNDNFDQSKKENIESGLKNSNIVKTSIGDYKKEYDHKGEAFCLGCRKTDQIKNLLYNEKSDNYYHFDCLEKFMDKPLDKDEKEKMVYDFELTTKEQKQVDAFIKFGIKPNECLVINKTTRNIDKFNDKEWEKINQSEWIILIEK